MIVHPFPNPISAKVDTVRRVQTVSRIGACPPPRGFGTVRGDPTPHQLGPARVRSAGGGGERGRRTGRKTGGNAVE